MRESSFVLGNGRKTTFVCKHGLKTYNPHVTMYDTATGERFTILPLIRLLDENTMEVAFSQPPSHGAYKLYVTYGD